jgi:hypothetical protein
MGTIPDSSFGRYWTEKLAKRWCHTSGSCPFRADQHLHLNYPQSLHISSDARFERRLTLFRELFVFRLLESTPFRPLTLRGEVGRLAEEPQSARAAAPMHHCFQRSQIAIKPMYRPLTIKMQQLTISTRNWHLQCVFSSSWGRSQRFSSRAAQPTMASPI